MNYGIDRLRPLSIGLDDFFNFANALMAETPVKFPPYNIHKLDDSQYTIEMALAGYKKEDIELTSHDGVLTIQSVKQSEPTDDAKTLHKGISNRAFSKSFGLADNVVVRDASLLDGMLVIKLEQIIPEEKKRKVITIN